MLKIGILPGDDIGLEVVPEAVKVMKAAAEKTALEIDWRALPIGRRAHETHGHTLPPETVGTLKTLHGWLLGPIGHSAYPRNDPTWVAPPLRKMFELYASVKPVKIVSEHPLASGERGHRFRARSERRARARDTVVAGYGEYHAERRDFHRNARSSPAPAPIAWRARHSRSRNTRQAEARRRRCTRRPRSSCAAACSAKNAGRSPRISRT